MKIEDDKAPDLKTRTKRFALASMELCSRLPKTTAGQVIERQLLRSGTSVGAQYREATRGRSDAEYAAKVGGALQELEESGYWLELLVESHMLPAEKIGGLMSEADELTAILVTCSNKARRKGRGRRAGMKTEE